MSYQADGHFLASHQPGERDLVNVPVRHNVRIYVVFYKDGQHVCMTEENWRTAISSETVAVAVQDIDVPEGTGIDNDVRSLMEDCPF